MIPHDGKKVCSAIMLSIWLTDIWFMEQFINVLMGMPVTHGCVRLGDDDLVIVFNTLNIGSKVYIFWPGGTYYGSRNKEETQLFNNTTYHCLFIVVIAFLTYYSMMEMRSTSKKMAEISAEYGFAKYEKGKLPKNITSDSTFLLSLFKEQAYLQSRVANGWNGFCLSYFKIWQKKLLISK